MSDTYVIPIDEIIQRRDAFIERFMQSMSGAFNIFSIYIGDRLGLYRALAENGLSTSKQLSSRTSTDERYIREWIEQQTVAGILEVEDETLPDGERRYRLPPGHVEPLINCDSPNYVAPLAQLMAGVVHPLPQLLDAYRNGGGVPFTAYGPDLRDGQAAINCPAFTRQLPYEWLPAIPDIHARLQREPSARVADIGCGYGWSSIGMAQGYPKIHVDGFDLDEESIKNAVGNARANGVADRVSFQVRDAGDPALKGKYDLVTAFECIHDMSNPVAVLRIMRHLAGAQGTVLVVDEKAGDKFAARGNDLDWYLYGFSILHCLPVGMVDLPGVGTGTVMRQNTLRQYASQAGFNDVEVLPIDNYFFRFYRLVD
jgi:2-polyprenyl-3-methyl-5-hydroxy-6-metoxy-1,4-benzoquinol methylase